MPRTDNLDRLSQDLQAIGIALGFAAELARQNGINLEEWRVVSEKAFLAAYNRHSRPTTATKERPTA